MDVSQGLYFANTRQHKAWAQRVAVWDQFAVQDVARSVACNYSLNPKGAQSLLQTPAQRQTVLKLHQGDSRVPFVRIAWANNMVSPDSGLTLNSALRIQYALTASSATNLAQLRVVTQRCCYCNPSMY